MCVRQVVVTVCLCLCVLCLVEVEMFVEVEKWRCFQACVRVRFAHLCEARRALGFVLPLDDSGEAVPSSSSASL